VGCKIIFLLYSKVHVNVFKKYLLNVIHFFTVEDKWRINNLKVALSTNEHVFIYNVVTKEYCRAINLVFLVSNFTFKFDLRNSHINTGCHLPSIFSLPDFFRWWITIRHQYPQMDICSKNKIQRVLKLSTLNTKKLK
jgi:hypothetical protein